MSRNWQQLGREADGAQIAETALVMPLVFMFLLGIFWFGRAFNIYSTITYAAREGAIVAARPNCAGCGNTLPLPGVVETRVKDALRASKLNAAQVAVYNVTPSPVFCTGVTPAGACTVSGNVTVCRGVRLGSAASTPPSCGALVSFQYPYQFHFPFTSLDMQLFNLPAAAEVPMEY